jgi:hypothetical protein
MFTHDDAVIHKLIASLRHDFKLTDEGEYKEDITAYLGINVIRHADGRIEINQPGLIEWLSKCVGW